MMPEQQAATVKLTLNDNIQTMASVCELPTFGPS